MNKVKPKRRWPLIIAVLLISASLIGINIIYTLQLRSVQQLEGQAVAKRDETTAETEQLQQQWEEMRNTQYDSSKIDTLFWRTVQLFRTNDLQDVALAVMEKFATPRVVSLHPPRGRTTSNGNCHNGGRRDRFWIKVPEPGHSLVWKISRIVNPDRALDIEDHPVLPGDIQWVKIPLDPGQVYRVGYEVGQGESSLAITLNDEVVFEKRLPGQTFLYAGGQGRGNVPVVCEPGIALISGGLLHEKTDWNVNLLQQGCWAFGMSRSYDFTDRPDGKGDPTLRISVENYLQFEGDIYREPSYLFDRLKQGRINPVTGAFESHWTPSPSPDLLSHPTYPDLIRIQKTGETDTEK